MFSVLIEDEKVFTNFLDSSDLDYVDMYLHDTTATMIMNTSDVFCALSLQCNHTPNETSHGFRVSRNLLRQQKRANTLAIRFNDTGNVSISFMIGNTLICDAEFVYQKVYSTSYSHKLDLLRSEAVPSGLRIEELLPLVKISSALGGLINIESGIASANLANGTRIYKQVKYKDSLCISPKYAQLLRKCDDTLFTIKDYIGAYKDNFAILISKLRVISNQDFTSLNMARSQYYAEIDLSNLVAFANSHSMKVPHFEISLPERRCNFIEGEISYKIPITIKEEKKAKADPYKEFELPFSTVKTILPTLGYTTVVLEKKQFFVKLEAGPYTIMYN